MPIPSGLDADALRHSDREFPIRFRGCTAGYICWTWRSLPRCCARPSPLIRIPKWQKRCCVILFAGVKLRDMNRDKTDLIATFLYRHPRVPGQWEQRGYGLDGALPLSPFEIALIEILADTDVPSLPEEHVQLLRRFDPFLEEVKDFVTSTHLIDSAMIGRVRELKQWLDASFYHPGVLATVSAYNTAFGKKFDDFS